MWLILKYYLIGMAIYAIYHFAAKTFWEIKDDFTAYRKYSYRWTNLPVYFLEIICMSLIFPISFPLSMIGLYQYLRSCYYIRLNKRNNPNWTPEDGDWDRF